MSDLENKLKHRRINVDQEQQQEKEQHQQQESLSTETNELASQSTEQNIDLTKSLPNRNKKKRKLRI